MSTHRVDLEKYADSKMANVINGAKATALAGRNVVGALLYLADAIREQTVAQRRDAALDRKLRRDG